MTSARVVFAAVCLGLFGLPAQAHGGRFTGPRGGPPPGLPTQPDAPGGYGGSYHTWTTWWSYNQYKYINFRRRQVARRGAVTGKKQEKEDPNAWRKALRQRFTPLMIEALTDEDEEVRTAAAVALGKWNVRAAIPDLRKAWAKDDVLQVREAALLGMLLMRDPSLRGFWMELAGSKKEKLRIRGFALLGMGLIGDPQSRTYLLAVLDPKDKHTRKFVPRKDRERREFLAAAAAALTQVKVDGIANDFLAIAQNKRQVEEVRAYALSAIGKLRATQHKAAILKVLKSDRSEHMRRSAAIALGLLADRKDADVIEELGRRLKRDKDRIVTHFAAISLGQIGGPVAHQVLVEAYRNANKEARSFYLIAFGLSKEKEGSEILKRELVSLKDARDRAACALALGLAEESSNAPAVRGAFGRAKDWLLMQASMLALGILNDTASADKIKEVLIKRRIASVRTSAALAFALLRQWEAVPVFTGLLRSAKRIVTLSTIAQVMGFLGSPKASDALVGLYKDKNLQRQARAFALVALGALGDPSDFPVLIRLAFDINYLIRSDPVDEAMTIL